MISIVNEKTTSSGFTILVSQAIDSLLVHDYEVVIKKQKQGKQQINSCLLRILQSPVPNSLILQIDGLQTDTLYKIEVSALDSYGNLSTNSLNVLGKTLDTFKKHEI
jgi:hypothetical protein